VPRHVGFFCFFHVASPRQKNPDRPVFSELSETWLHSVQFVASPLGCRNRAVRVDSCV
jgi:hypothetical protein